MIIFKRLLAVLSLCALASSASAQSYENLTTDAVAELLKKDPEHTGFVLLDVRTPSEYSEGHLRKSLNIDLNNSNFAQEVSKLDKAKYYVVYCRSGRRSAAAAEQMKSLGFDKISNMLGGTLKWMSESRPLEK